MNINRFFGTPKRTILTLVAVLICLFAVGAGSVFATNALSVKNTIGKASALNKALADAGLSEKDIDFADVDLEYNNGSKEYEIEFIGKGNEYHYLIDAKSGLILSKDIDGDFRLGIIKKNPVSVASNVPEIVIPTQTSKPAETPDKTEVQEPAVQPVNNEAPKAAEAPPVTVEPIINVAPSAVETPENNKVPVNTEAPINNEPANNYDSNPNNNGQKTNTQISLDEAKAIALSHSGASPAEASFSMAKLDNDDGRMEYEIEFYAGQMEYEYSIDAYSGAIIEYESEHDD